MISLHSKNVHRALLALLLNLASYAAAADCGDGVCTPDESCNSCVIDCGTCCGDGLCEEAIEDCSSCPSDCGVCDNACAIKKCEGEDCLQGCEAQPGCNPNCVKEDTCATISSVKCGDGNCDAAADEDCDVCPEDCPCKVTCGNGECEPPEDCGNCPDDCGQCEQTAALAVENPLCTAFESNLGFKYKQKLDPIELATPQIAGSDLKVRARGLFSATGGTLNERCRFKGQVGGAVELCASWLGTETCVGQSLSGLASCNSAFACINPPVNVCMSNSVCCNGSVRTAASLGRRVNFLQSLGPFQCKASLGVSFDLDLVIDEAQIGRSQSCAFKTGILNPQIRSDVFALGACAFNVGSAKANASLTIQGCGRIKREGENILRGITVKYGIEPITIGWLYFGGRLLFVNQGDKCSLFERFPSGGSH